MSIATTQCFRALNWSSSTTFCEKIGKNPNRAFQEFIKTSENNQAGRKS
jgi:hypothetical protein